MVSEGPVAGFRTGKRIRELPVEASRLAREQGRRNAGLNRPVRDVSELFRAKTLHGMNLGEEQGKPVSPFGELPSMTPDLMAQFARNVRKYQRSNAYKGMEGGASQADWAYESDDVEKGDYEYFDVPAQLTKIPMGTSNRRRPRVVAAGYDEHVRTLTVVFRDGTYYNYYDVKPEEWATFRSAPSTKMWIGGWEGGGLARRKRIGVLDPRPRGVAETGALNPESEMLLHSIGRAVQMSSRYGRRA